MEHAPETPRDQFLRAAHEELVAFEQREREFSRKERQERAAKLQIPAEALTQTVHIGRTPFRSGRR